jgi:hypothetical protein
MKHKYVIEKNDEQKQLIIKEYAELDKEILSFLCQETYAQEKITAAITRGKEALISTLRTHNMYPSGSFANKIAEAVMAMFGPEPSQSREVIVDDIDFITKRRIKRKVQQEVLTDDTELEDLLEDDFDEDFEDKPPLKKINSSLKVVDDEYEDIDDEDNK